MIVDLQRPHTGEGSVFKLRKSINGGTERWGHGVPNSGQDHLPPPILFAEDVSETHKSFGQRTISWWGSLNAVLDQRYIREEQLCSITHGTKFAARLDWPEELTQEILETPTPTQTPAKRVLPISIFGEECRVFLFLQMLFVKVFHQRQHGVPQLYLSRVRHFVSSLAAGSLIRWGREIARLGNKLPSVANPQIVNLGVSSHRE